MPANRKLSYYTALEGIVKYIFSKKRVKNEKKAGSAAGMPFRKFTDFRLDNPRFFVIQCRIS